MGGNLFNVERMTTATLNAIYADICHALAGMNLRMERLPFYRQKATHGDLDILLAVQSYDVSFREINERIAARLGNPKMVMHGTTAHLFYMGKYQVDIMHTDCIDSMGCYYSYNDLGGLLSRTARVLGLQLGDYGLTARIIDSSGRKHGDFIFSSDWREILPALQYDYQTWADGFETLEDIYRFVVSSPYFSRKSGSGEFSSNRRRLRDAKRSTIIGFREWLKETQTHDYPVDVTILKGSTFPTAEGEAMLKKCWPEKWAEYQQALLAADQPKEEGLGRRVMRLTGCEGGVLLGRFLKTVNREMSDDELITAYRNF